MPLMGAGGPHTSCFMLLRARDWSRRLKKPPSSSSRPTSMSEPTCMIPLTTVSVEVMLKVGFEVSKYDRRP